MMAVSQDNGGAYAGYLTLDLMARHSIDYADRDRPKSGGIEP